MRLLVTLLFTLFAAAASAQVPPPPPPPMPTPSMPPRDMPFTPPSGGASISGRVVSTDERPTPIRSVVLTLRGDGFRTGWTFVTDATGTFSFTDLPPGRFVLAASRPGFPAMNYGAPRPGRPGASIVLKDNEHVADLSIALPRGAVITGRVVDDAGAPVENSRVVAGPVIMRNGERTMGFGGTATTDDRGEFRIFGLAAGDYAVSISSRSVFGSSGVTQYTAAEIDAVVAGNTSVARPGQAPPPPPDGQEMAQTPIFFPSVGSLADAALIHLEAGETRTGIDLRMAYLPAVSISGTLLDPDGKPPAGVVMNLVQIGAARGPAVFGHPSPKDGSFVLTGLTPGRYAITARATPQGGRGAAAMPPLWSRTDIDIHGVPITGMNIRLQTGSTIHGSVAFDSGPEATPPTSLRIALTPVASPGDISIGVGDTAVNQDGTFDFAGVIPGRYRVNAQSPGVAAPLWSIKSAIVNGQDALDSPFEVSTADLDGLAITFTNKVTGVTGSLQDASGRPAPDYYVIVFPSDPAFWFQGSRRIKAVRPTIGGGYLVRGLPPGSYRIGAVTDVETNEWFEPSFLQQLLPASAELTLVEGEVRPFSLKIGG